MKKTLENLGFTLSGFTSSELVEVEIPNPVKRAKGRYPQKGWTPTIKVMRPKSALGKNVTMSGTPASFVALFSAAIENKLDANHAANVTRIDTFWPSSRDGFCGGSFDQLKEDLAGKPDLTRFMQAKERLLQSDVMEKFTLELESLSPRRKRIFGDSGQWIEERRFESEAFEDFKRKPSPARSINFELECSENGDASADRLASFGAISWAIIDTLESFGISCGVKLNYSGKDSWAGNETQVISVNLKEAGEYLSPSFMAGVMTPNFFRRAIFTAIACLADSANAEVNPGLGYSQTFSAARYEPETSTLRICAKAIEYPWAIIDEVLKALNQEVAA